MSTATKIVLGTIAISALLSILIISSMALG